jgi:Flp pilus assembly protein TadD
MSGLIERLRATIAAGRDGALARYALGKALIEAGESAAATQEFERALGFDPNYSAAYKALGQALAEQGRAAEALATYRRGIEVAQGRGDKQIAKEMAVFAKRLETAAGSAA